MTRRLLLTLLACTALSLTASAQDQAPDPASDEAGADEEERSPESSPVDEDDAPEAVEEEEFIFSEEIPADQQVTFPVDI